MIIINIIKVSTLHYLIAIVPLIVFYLNLIGMKINTLNTFLTILGVILITLIIMVIKKKSISKTFKLTS